MRNLWYFLYDPGWFHTRYNPIPIFQGGLFFPPDGEGPTVGGQFGANAAVLGLPPLATKELAFDSLSAQPKWIQQTYSKIRTLWLDSYGAIEHAMFYLMIAASAALMVDWMAALLRLPVLRRWSNVVNANGLAGHIFYVTAYLLYNSVIIAAFVDPDYRYNDMALLIKLLLAGFGAIVLIRFACEVACVLVPSLRKHGEAKAIQALRDEVFIVDRGLTPGIVAAIGIVIAVCSGWTLYMIRHI
jgi:hypothetical protein